MTGPIPIEQIEKYGFSILCTSQCGRLENKFITSISPFIRNIHLDSPFSSLTLEMNYFDEGLEFELKTLDY